jgi:small basic protein
MASIGIQYLGGEKNIFVELISRQIVNIENSSFRYVACVILCCLDWKEIGNIRKKVSQSFENCIFFLTVLLLGLYKLNTVS